jgi:DNA polymerase phi
VSLTRQLRDIPAPVFSEDLRKLCRERLLSSLAELTAHSTLVKTGGCVGGCRRPSFGLIFFPKMIDDKTSKVAAVASDGEFWVSKVLSTIDKLEKDPAHVSLLANEDDEDEHALFLRAKELIGRLKLVSCRSCALCVYVAKLHRG